MHVSIAVYSIQAQAYEHRTRATEHFHSFAVVIQVSNVHIQYLNGLASGFCFLVFLPSNILNSIFCSFQSEIIFVVAIDNAHTTHHRTEFTRRAPFAA